MKRVQDIREEFDRLFTPKTKEIEGVKVGDVKGATIQDRLGERGTTPKRFEPSKGD